MRCFLPLAALLSVALAGQSQIAVRLPFLNPAGVTYVGGPAHPGLVAGPAVNQHLTYAANPAFARQSTYHGSPFAYHAAPYAHRFAQPVHHVAQPVHHIPHTVHHVAQPLAAVHHVPAVANVPVTHYEATHGVVQKVVDVAHPAVKTRKFHVRRPAIQKQFYDIEERVVVRPAGSALVELDEPISKEQRGGAVISPALHHPIPAVRVFPGYKALHAIPNALLHTYNAPSAPAAPTGPAPTDAFPTDQPTSTPDSPRQDSFDDTDSVSVGNSDFRSSMNGQENQGQEQQQDSVSNGNSDFSSSMNGQENQGQEQQRDSGFDSVFRSSQNGQENQGQEQQQEQQNQQQEQQGEQQQQQEEQQPQQEEMNGQQQGQQQEQQQEQNNGQAFQQGSQFQSSGQFQSEKEQFDARQFNFAALAQQQQSTFTPDPIPGQNSFQGRSQDSQASNGQTEVTFQGRALESNGRSVFPSLRNLDSASSRANQQRLIQLLTARDGVVEVGFGRQGAASGHNIDAGGVRARVISATPAPHSAEPTGERVSTRRVVVSRPVETLQELDVIQPITKLQRVAVNTPAVFKTARLGVARVATSVPVLQKTYAHPAPLLYQKTLAHAPAPFLYQKTLAQAPAYSYY